jgi:hypothetical protein
VEAFSLPNFHLCQLPHLKTLGRKTWVFSRAGPSSLSGLWRFKGLRQSFPRMSQLPPTFPCFPQHTHTHTPHTHTHHTHTTHTRTT